MAWAKAGAASSRARAEAVMSGRSMGKSPVTQKGRPAGGPSERIIREGLVGCGGGRHGVDGRGHRVEGCGLILDPDEIRRGIERLGGGGEHPALGIVSGDGEFEGA